MHHEPESVRKTKRDQMKNKNAGHDHNEQMTMDSRPQPIKINVKLQNRKSRESKRERFSHSSAIY